MVVFLISISISIRDFVIYENINFLRSFKPVTPVNFNSMGLILRQIYIKSAKVVFGYADARLIGVHGKFYLILILEFFTKIQLICTFFKISVPFVHFFKFVLVFVGWSVFVGLALGCIGVPSAFATFYGAVPAFCELRAVVRFVWNGGGRGLFEISFFGFRHFWHKIHISAAFININTKIPSIFISISTLKSFHLTPNLTHLITKAITLSTNLNKLTNHQFTHILPCQGYKYYHYRYN